MDIVWYPAKDDAPWLPFPSGVVSLDWDRQEMELGVYADKPTGEVANRPRTYNGQTVKPAATGLHQCGTPEMFADGAAFNASVNRPKRADGLPACCGMLAMGVVVGGRVLTFGTGAVIGGHDLAREPAGTSGIDPGFVYTPVSDGDFLAYQSQTTGPTDRVTMNLNFGPSFWRVRLWTDPDFTDVRLVAGTGFSPNGFTVIFPDPTAGFFEWVAPPISPFQPIWSWYATKGSASVRVYGASAEPIP